MINRCTGFVIAYFLVGAVLLSGCLNMNDARPEPPAASAAHPNQIELKPQVRQEQPARKFVRVVLPVEPNDDSPARPQALPVEPEEATPTAPATVESAPLPAPTALPELANPLPAEQWKEWPVLPSVSAEMRAVYQRGLAQGRSPNAFSVLGDCQSQPEVFMGVFDSDPIYRTALPDSLRETVDQFAGSFDRYSPTVKDGTTEGALLWYEWNDNKEKKCLHGETPLDCELRVHQPSIVFIHVGTHWESRNLRYLKTIIERILDQGGVPVLVTKADNRELDERVNQNMAFLAAEYNLPMWNFWASVQHLPENGMMRNSDMYLSEEGMEVHRMGALDALDAVWRAVREHPAE